MVKVFCALCLLSSTAYAQAGRFAVFLDQDPATRAAVTAALKTRHITITGSAARLIQAVFVEAQPERVSEIRAIRGVRGVSPLGSRRLQLNQAAPLINAPAAWAALGGITNAGLGIRIGIIDSGIDQTHAAFQDPSLPYIPCTTFPGNNCAYTNTKVIVARSYIQQLGVGATVNPATSRPDDFSPADHVGHGTAVAMIAAGFTVNSPQGTITGIAPKAYLGNYKVRGSNGINEIISDQVLILALEDALNDGMNVVNISAGGLPLTGPLDSGTSCGNAPGVPCDPLAAAAEAAIASGMVIVCAAGDQGQAGNIFPSLATVVSPANSPSVIAVAATSNSHNFLQGLQLNTATPQTFTAQYAGGAAPLSSLTATVKDVASLGTATACSALPANSLAGVIALAVQSTTSNCTWVSQAQNLAAAGAAGIIFSLATPAALTTPAGLTSQSIPAAVISLADGVTLRAGLSGNVTATLSPSILIAASATPELVAGYSSRGPGLVSGSIKPELAAVGTSVYTAAEKFDPSGDLYSANGFAVASGSSFASPMVAGAAALVLQANRSFTPAQVKSALVNTAANSAIDGSQPAGTLSTGAGFLNVANAVATSLTVSPSTIAFGVLNGATLPIVVPVQLTNTQKSPLSLSISATAGLQVSIDQPTFSISPQQTVTINVRLAGPVPSAGEYEGQITIAGPPVPVHIPFQYVVGNGLPYNMVPISGDRNVGTAGQPIPDGVLAVQVTDRYGVPIANLNTTFKGPAGSSVSPSSVTTNSYGIAKASASFAPAVGTQTFTATAGSLTYNFVDAARAVPTISSAGVVDAASNTAGKGIAPGSYVTLYGANIAETSAVAGTATLMPALNDVSVSFDVPSSNLSVVGHVVSVSPYQINVQVPWELSGATSVQMKVNLDRSQSSVITVPVSPYSPNFFLYGSRLAAALNGLYALISASNPAVRGQSISVYANGLGPVTNQPASGSPALTSPLSATTTVPVVSIGGVQATVLFSGLAPGYPGLYQINLIVPTTVPTGPQPMIMTMGGLVSNTAILNVQ